nr:hypothetical protein [Tenuifilaceae bacterium]
MEIKKNKIWRSLALLIFIGLTGCYDFSKLENISIDPVEPVVVVPVINSTISFYDLVERSDANTFVFQKPGDSQLYIAFRDTISIGDAATEFTIPPLAIIKNYQFGSGELPLPVPAGQTIGPITKTLTETYSTIPGAEIKSIVLSQGTLSYRITNKFTSGFEIVAGSTITITSLKNPQGQSYVIPITQDRAPEQDVSSSNINVTGYTIDLHNTTYNTFTLSADIKFRSQTGSPMTTSDYISIEVSLNNIDYTYIQGKINKDITVGDYDYKVDLFRSTYVADQHFDDPRLTFKIFNSYGIPVFFNINQLEASNTNPDPDEMLLVVNSGAPTTNTLKIGTPNELSRVMLMGNSPVKDSLVLNKDNSNIDVAFDLAPNQFKLRSGITLGDASSNHDYFVAKDSKLSIASEIELPLIGWVETNQINDTIVDVELPDLESELNLKEGDSLKVTIKFRFRNGIPLNTYFQAYFLNDLNQELTKLYTDENWLIKSAAVDPTSGKVTNPTINYSEVVINRSKYNLIKDATKIVLQYRFKTGGNSSQAVVIEDT